MTAETDRPRVIKAIKVCLSDAYDNFQDAMEQLDEIGKGEIGTSMTPLIGGYALKDPKDNYRSALISVDAGQKALEPLLKRINDGRVNETHFKDEKALLLLKDIADFEYSVLVEKMSERKGRESVWYRLRELSEKIEQVFKLVVKD